MHVTNISNNRATLQRALLAAICEVADLDQSIPTGCYPVVPDVVMWMIDATQPELSAEIDNRNLRETTLGLIEEYGILRRRAWDCSFGRKCIVLPARLDTHHLVEAIDGLGLNLTVLFKELFNAIEPYVAERLDLLDVINWGEEAPDEQARAGEDVRESAHNHCDSYWSLRTASLDAGKATRWIRRLV